MPPAANSAALPEPSTVPMQVGPLKRRTVVPGGELPLTRGALSLAGEAGLTEVGVGGTGPGGDLLVGEARVGAGRNVKGAVGGGRVKGRGRVGRDGERDPGCPRARRPCRPPPGCRCSWSRCRSRSSARTSRRRGCTRLAAAARPAGGDDPVGAALDRGGQRGRRRGRNGAGQRRSLRRVSLRRRVPAPAGRRSPAARPSRARRRRLGIGLSGASLTVKVPIGAAAAGLSPRARAALRVVANVRERARLGPLSLRSMPAVITGSARGQSTTGPSSRRSGSRRPHPGCSYRTASRWHPG